MRITYTHYSPGVPYEDDILQYTLHLSRAAITVAMTLTVLPRLLNLLKMELGELDMVTATPTLSFLLSSAGGGGGGGLKVFLVGHLLTGSLIQSMQI